MAPENISPLVVWLGSAESKDVTGRVFEVEGGKITVRRAGVTARARTREIAGTEGDRARRGNAVGEGGDSDAGVRGVGPPAL